jgi:hypothetical protein
MSRLCNHDYSFELPPEFVNAKEKFIVVRQCRALFGFATEPFDHELNDVMLLSDLVDDCYLANEDINRAWRNVRQPLGYVCLCNDTAQRREDISL